MPTSCLQTPRVYKTGILSIESMKLSGFQKTNWTMRVKVIGWNHLGYFLKSVIKGNALTFIYCLGHSYERPGFGPAILIAYSRLPLFGAVKKRAQTSWPGGVGIHVVSAR